MIQEVRTNIEYLVNKQYMNQKKKTDEIEKRLGIIHQCYEVVYRAAFLKAFIFNNAGEIKAMLTSIAEYGRFVERLIVPYAGQLSELDKHDRFIESGTWGTISKTLEDCKKLSVQFDSKYTYVLDMGGSNNGD